MPIVLRLNRMLTFYEGSLAQNLEEAKIGMMAHDVLIDYANIIPL